MTLLDSKLPQAVYYENSNFPCEYGGGRRQKHTRTRGLNIQPHERLQATTRRFEPGKWAMYTTDADGRVFVIGTTVPVQPIISFGWIEEVEPITLERIAVSPNLETGGHNFCGGSLLLADGHFLACFGRYIHKLDLGDDSVWFMDMGDSEILKGIMTATPVGTVPPDLSGEIYPYSGAVRLHRVSTEDSASIDSLNLFDVPHGWQSASPLYAPEKRIAMGFDTANGKVGAWKYHGPGNFSHLWTHNITNSNQPLYYPDTGEVIVDDVHMDQSVDMVVLDLETGEEKGRVNTGTKGTQAWRPLPASVVIITVAAVLKERSIVFSSRQTRCSRINGAIEW